MSGLTQKPILVGEANPYGGEPKFALYPAPDGCSGHRLCCLILGMRRSQYLDTFERVNLCPQEWSNQVARERAKALFMRPGHPRFILLGSKVCRAFGMSYGPFGKPRVFGRSTFIDLPHPSSRNRAWNDPNSIMHARTRMVQICPELFHLIGSSDRDDRQPTRVGDDGVMEGN